MTPSLFDTPLLGFEMNREEYLRWLKSSFGVQHLASGRWLHKRRFDADERFVLTGNIDEVWMAQNLGQAISLADFLNDRGEVFRHVPIPGYSSDKNFERNDCFHRYCMVCGKEGGNHDQLENKFVVLCHDHWREELRHVELRNRPALLDLKDPECVRTALLRPRFHILKEVAETLGLDRVQAEWDAIKFLPTGRKVRRKVRQYLGVLRKAGGAKPLSGASPSPSGPDEDRITVFIAEPITKRPIAQALEGDTPEDIAERQEILDFFSGWKDRKHEDQ